MTSRKIIVDSYGGMGRHGGGAFSRDSSEVDGRAADNDRWVAKILSASGVADRCEVQFAYAIRNPEPVSVSIDTFCTGKVDDEKLEHAVVKSSISNRLIIKQLNFLPPIYRKTSNYGHFGRVDIVDAMTWKLTDRAEHYERRAR